MTHADGLSYERLSAPRTARGSLAVALQLPLFPCSSLADALAPGWRSALDGAATAASGNGGNKSKLKNAQAPCPLAQQQPFFFPDLVLTFLLPSLLFFSLPSLLFFSFLDFFLPATASAAASTAEDAAPVTGATTDCTAANGSPMALASRWISSSVTGWPAMSFWNISGEMLMRCGSAGAARSSSCCGSTAYADIARRGRSFEERRGQ